MKIKKGDFEFDGTPQELKDTFINHNFNPDSFFKVDKAIDVHAYILPFSIFVFGISNIVLWMNLENEIVFKISAIIGFISLFVSIGVAHVKYKSWIVTALSVLGGVMIISITSGSKTINDAIVNFESKVTINK